ncbi:hypothetical protein Prudu_206S000300 [Prunus dulcis]|uniref:Uncharacterized protein n=1 Tax=Prunus dulcis TaxID=3755 RepID=A0A5H2XHI6_PRUDU|nr:hypothetical protein Prudu_206S000300 [Prunus dulcis]
MMDNNQQQQVSKAEKSYTGIMHPAAILYWNPAPGSNWNHAPSSKSTLTSPHLHYAGSYDT